MATPTTSSANYVPGLGSVHAVDKYGVQTSAGQIATYVVGVGTNTITATLAPAISAYLTGMHITLIPANDNTGAATLNLNSLGAKAIKKYDGNTALSSGDLQAGMAHELVYDSTNFILMNASASGTVTNPMDAIGQIIYGGASGTQTKLAAQTTTTQKFLAETGDGSAGTAPVWTTIGSNDLKTLYQATDTGSANAYAIALTPAIAALAAGQIAVFKAANANTTASTLAINGLTAKNIYKNGVALTGGEILANGIYQVVYDGTQYQLQSPYSLQDADLPVTMRHIKVTLSAVNIAGMYAAPVEIIAAPGSNKAIIVHDYSIVKLLNNTAYANGGNTQLQYGTTTHAGGQAIGAVIANTFINNAASVTAYRGAADLTSIAYTVQPNVSVCISNASQAFDTGDGTALVDVWYSVIATA